MAKLPMVEVEYHEIKDWLEPSEIEEALRVQPRCVCPDGSNLKWTVLFTIVPGTYFLRCVLPRALESGQVLRESRSCVACVSWAVLCLVAFAAAAFRNPGVVPRAITKSGSVSVTIPARYVNVNGVQVKQRWCSTCRVYRPLRSKHCSYCDRCVFRFDHHCTWLGNCVGLGNYRSFLVLILAAALFFGHSAVIAFKVLWRVMYEVPGGLETSGLETAAWSQVLWKLFLSNGFQVLYTAYATAMFVAFVVLILYHAVIMACNLTTNEHVRDYYLARNPFDVDCVDNYRQICCSPYGRNFKGKPASQQHAENSKQTLVVTPPTDEV
ncbi:unnamed protein product [Polarella glacialis]|uniref:Palmitoyltransferase n=1 Tax=Polarella glacialis TaxID=89957 RepID=A0A813KWW0_POLGL|nr:unnamed protein product [Polarella glacialis]